MFIKTKFALPLIASLLLISCEAGKGAVGELSFSPQAPASSPRYTPEDAFRLLHEKYQKGKRETVVGNHCIVFDDKYFFPVAQKTLSWRKEGHWVDPFTGEYGEYHTAPGKAPVYVEDGVYQGVLFERQKDGSYKSSPHTYHLGVWPNLRKRYLGGVT